MRTITAQLSRLLRWPVHPSRLSPRHQRYPSSLPSHSSRAMSTSSPSSPPSPSPAPFKAGVIQLNCGADLDANFQQCTALIRRAAALGAQIVFTPENTTRLTSLTLPFSIASAHFESDHPSLPLYRRLARSLSVWIALGSVAVRAEDDPTKLANRSLLISPHPHPNDADPTLGRVVARYDKVHMFDVPTLDPSTSESYLESSRVRPGHAVPIVSTPFGRIGLTVCYDLRFPPLYLALASHSAHLITVPSAFTVTTGRAHWHALLRARAIETGTWVVAAAQSGEHPGGRVTWGHSLVVNPWGEVVGELEREGEGLMVVDIDPAMVNDARRRIPSLQNRRPFEVVSVDAEAVAEDGEGRKGGQGQVAAQSQTSAL